MPLLNLHFAYFVTFRSGLAGQVNVLLHGSVQHMTTTMLDCQYEVPFLKSSVHRIFSHLFLLFLIVVLFYCKCVFLF